MSASAGTVSAAFQLQDLRVHPATGRIVGPNSEVHLKPRVMAVLEVLARSPGELVTRNELLDDLWPGGEVYDESLTQTVYQLRQQLETAGGSGEYRNMITTVPKRGYVLNAEVGSVEPEALPAETSRVPEFQRRWMVYASVLVLILVATWAVLRWPSEPGPVLETAGTGSVAVLPFLPLVADAREPVLEMGMADTLITRMGGIRELVIRPMTSVRRYDGLDRDALEAGRKLGVDAVLDGSIQRNDDTLRVSVRLLRVADGRALWADTIYEPFSNIFGVQDRISERIAQALSLELGREERREMARGGTENSQAYEHYMQGRYLLARFTPRDLRESVDQFSAAVELDPGYTQAWLGLANVLLRSPVSGEAPPLEYYPRAIEAANRALELDPDSAEAYAYLGWIAQWFEWDWVASEAHFKRAIELNPDEVESHFGYAHLLGLLGRREEQVFEIRRARELNPSYMLSAALEGGMLVGAGKPEEALRQMEAARAIGEDLWLFRLILASVYRANGRFEEAQAEYEQAELLSDGGTWVLVNKIVQLRSAGQDSEAEALFARMLRQSQEQYVPPYDMAVAYRAMGDLDMALVMLERAYELRDPKMLFIRQWTELRDRPRYERLVRGVNLPPREESQ